MPTTQTLIELRRISFFFQIVPEQSCFSLLRKMNTLAFFFVLIWGIPDTRADSSPSLPVLYYPFEKIYVLSELSVIERMLEDGSQRLNRFQYVLLYCGERSQTNEYATLNNGKIFKNTQKALKQAYYCSWHYNPKMYGHGDHTDGYSGAIGYGALTNSAKLTNPYALPVFPRENDALALVIWYQLDQGNTYTTQTVHHFYVYKRSLLPDKSCNDYDLAEGTQFENAIKECFEKESQDEMFDDLDVTDGGRTSPESSGKQYFVAHPMVPINDFLEDSMRMAACTTYFTRTPVWQSISEGPIKIVEKFIQRLAEELYIGTLKIRTEVYDWLKLPRRSYSLGVPVTLKYGDDKAIRVPKYFLKIVAYRPLSPLEEQFQRTSSIFRYYMVIVIHNELSNYSDRLCNKSYAKICEQYGWRVTIDGQENGPVYCCTFNDKDLRNAIKLYDTHQPFDLKNVKIPFYEERPEVWVFEDIAKKLATT